MKDSAARIAALEARVARLEAQRRLNDLTDEALEEALRERLPLEQSLARVAPILLAHTGARGLFLRTFDENLALRDFRFGEDHAGAGLDVDAVVAAAEAGEPYRPAKEGIAVVGQRLDVAGEFFGAVALLFEGPLSEDGEQYARDLMNTWCEELDNYLASIAQARQKLLVIRALSDALKEPVLDDGIDRALEVLRENVRFDDLLLVFRQEDDLAGASLHYKIIQGGRLTHDSSTPTEMDVDDFIRNEASAMVRGQSRSLLERFGITQFREEVMISGVRDERVLGRVVVTSTHGEFNTFDRDLLERFADSLRQRVVDFNREWKHLSLCFPPPVVRRLLREDRYRERFLAPREREVAILYTDLSGFTRVSEQVLRKPALIGQLIDTWSARVVDIVWETGGVFDKMVGDCVIALWGPPFHELDGRSLCRRAAEAARRIREYTQTLNLGREMKELRGLDPPVGVATGLHYCPLFVGLFGPNEDYTGFSSGMNNTARLQGVAQRDEILCMDGFVEAYGDLGAFGEERATKVKNVAEPLRYRCLL